MMPSSDSSGSTIIKHLFATPLVISDLSPEIVAEVNPQLKEIILKRSQESEGVVVSNRGGWQSDGKLLEWGGEPVSKILDPIRQLVRELTIWMKDQTYHKTEDANWSVKGWANVNRKGDSNVLHFHPGAYWSAVYYVAVDKSENADSKGGKIEFKDPRGCVPTLYCPVLRMGIDGCLTSGGVEVHQPKEGQCLIFPSWLYHAVTPYMGDETRISLAFNFSFREP